MPGLGFSSGQCSVIKASFPPARGIICMPQSALSVQGLDPFHV